MFPAGAGGGASALLPAFFFGEVALLFAGPIRLIKGEEAAMLVPATTRASGEAERGDDERGDLSQHGGKSTPLFSKVATEK